MAEFILPSGNVIPQLGLGSWYMGEDPRSRQQEIDALRFGIEYGAKLIDCAEMYGEGEAERIAGEAMAGYRDRLYVVSKFYPHNASREGVIAACERSLTRLNTDHLDLYLLHWSGTVPFEETLEALYQLKTQGKIRDYGVSNLDIDELEDFCAADKVGLCATDQVLYNLSHREPEWAVKPFCDKRNMAMMAYCPLDQGALVHHPELITIAERHQATAAQIALAWLIRQKGVVAIPKSSSIARTKENLDSVKIVLTEEDIRELDKAFPAPVNQHEGRIAIR
ncbi:aldo/keto reductase [Vibrio sp. dhg]|uniref:aldo/keto reductase n=1 Tax=Vibrio TaxID=662 RepID=UPI000E472338|nr:aldo/keto reductase [Vibrio sp. dhg]AXT72893.1 aldo/keto reductase [Vibrio sp. dhg]